MNPKTLQQLREQLPTYCTVKLGKWPHQYKSIQLNNEANQQLKHQLQVDGFFQFQPTNKGYIITEHQLVAYYCCGGLHAYKKGVINEDGQLEVHHIDGNTYNNEPSNLAYTPIWLHNQITGLQRRVHKYLKVFRKESVRPAESEEKLFNRRGTLIPKHGRIDYCVRLVVRSVLKTYKHAWTRKLDRALECTLSAPSLISKWVEKVSRRLKLGIDLSFIKSEWLDWQL